MIRAGVGRLGRGAVVAVVLVGLTGCVLADPAPTLPPVAERPPTIDLTSVYPPAGPGAVIATWPNDFTIPVYVSDPSQPLAWIAYSGYSSLPSVAGNTPLGAPTPFPADVDGGYVRTATLRIGLSRVVPCSTVTIVVANAFSGYTPVAPNYASVSWLYVPSGNPTDCNAYDAGYLVDGSFPPDALTDATLSDGGS